MHTCTCRKYPIIYINIQGYSKHSSYHTYIFFWKEYIYACSRYCVKITHVHILSILLPQTTHTHLKYFINIQIFCCSIPIYIYISAHWRANLTSRTHLHLKRNLHAIYLTLEGQFHIIYSFGKHSRAIFGMGTHFFERLLMLPIHNYTYLKSLIYYSLILQGIFMPYIHIYIYR